MANKKDTYYFSHDYNPRVDKKMKPLLRQHNMAGYGVYWCIVEDLYNNANALPTDYASIAYSLHTDEEVVRSVVEDFGLFVVQGDMFYSESVKRRLNDRALKSEKASASAAARWGNQPPKPSERNANALPSHTDSNAIKESKEKESKEKEKSESTASQPVATPLAEKEKKVDLKVEEKTGSTFNKLVGNLITDGIEARAELNHQQRKNKNGNKPESVEACAAKLKELCPTWTDEVCTLRAEQWYSGMESRYPTPLAWRISGREVKDWVAALRNKITFWKQDDLKHQNEKNSRNNRRTAIESGAVKRFD